MRRALLFAFAATLVFAQTKPLAPPAKPAPSAKPAAPAAPATPVAGGFVGNKSSKIFHKADCKAVAKMADKNKVACASKDEAVKAGFKPCKECKP